MSKTIKLEVPVYDRLEQVRAKRETFSEAMERLLDIHDKLGLITAAVQGHQDYHEWLNGKLKEKAAAH